MGASSVGRVIKFLGRVQQNWAGQCEIVGGVGLSCQRHDMQRPTVIANSSWVPVGAVSPPGGSGQSPGGGPGSKAPGSSWNFAFSSS